MDSPLCCADDRPQTLGLRKATLESKGYRVKLASSGYSAIKTLEKTSVVAVSCWSTNRKAWTQRP